MYISANMFRHVNCIVLDTINLRMKALGTLLTKSEKPTISASYEFSFKNNPRTAHIHEYLVVYSRF